MYYLCKLNLKILYIYKFNICKKILIIIYFSSVKNKRLIYLPFCEKNVYINNYLSNLKNNSLLLSVYLIDEFFIT